MRELMRIVFNDPNLTNVTASNSPDETSGTPQKAQDIVLQSIKKMGDFSSLGDLSKNVFNLQKAIGMFGKAFISLSNMIGLRAIAGATVANSVVPGLRGVSILN